MEILDNKEVNRVACRTLLRSGIVNHCKDLLMLKLNVGHLATTSVGLSLGKRLQWAASQYLTMLSNPQKCRLYRLVISDLKEAGKTEQLRNFLCHIYRQEKKFLDEDDSKHYLLKARVSALTYQGG